MRELLDGRLVVLAAATIIARAPAPGLDFTLTSRSHPSAQRRRAAPPRLDAALAYLAAAVPTPRRPHPWRRAYNPRLATKAGYPERGE